MDPHLVANVMAGAVAEEEVEHRDRPHPGARDDERGHRERVRPVRVRAVGERVCGRIDVLGHDCVPERIIVVRHCLQGAAEQEQGRERHESAVAADEEQN